MCRNPPVKTQGSRNPTERDFAPANARRLSHNSSRNFCNADGGCAVARHRRPSFLHRVQRRSSSVIIPLVPAHRPCTCTTVAAALGPEPPPWPRPPVRDGVRAGPGEARPRGPAAHACCGVRVLGEGDEGQRGRRGPHRVPRPWLILCDNEGFLTSKVAKKAHAEKGIALWQIPPRSPDLNPIEKFWGWLRREMRRRDLEDWNAKRPPLGTGPVSGPCCAPSRRRASQVASRQSC